MGASLQLAVTRKIVRSKPLATVLRVSVTLALVDRSLFDFSANEDENEHMYLFFPPIMSDFTFL